MRSNWVVLLQIDGCDCEIEASLNKQMIDRAVEPVDQSRYQIHKQRQVNTGRCLRIES